MSNSRENTLSQLQELAEAFVTLLDETKDSKNYEKVNPVFEKFLDALKVSDDKNIQEIEKICGLVSATIKKYDVKVLSIILDPNKINTAPDDEMILTAHQKREAFFKRKGLTSTLPFPSEQLNVRDKFLANLTTRVSFVCHGSTERFEDKEDPITQNLTHIICPLLADEKQFPHLERLTILACQSAYIEPKNINLFLMNNVDDKNKLVPPCYFSVIDSKESNSELFFFNDNKETQHLATIPLESKENTYFKSSQWNTLIKDTPYQSQRSANKIAQHMPALISALHKNIYDHAGNTLINQEKNMYVNQLLIKRESQLYLRGKVDSKEKQKIKSSLPGLNNLIFKTPTPEEKITTNYALRASSAINKIRSKKIEVKGYILSIKPSSSGSYMHPLVRDEIFGSPGKSIIYKPK